MSWSTTKSKMQTAIEHLVRRLSGNVATTSEMKTIISDAIEAALIDFSSELGVRWKFLLQDLTATTTSGTRYVDLTAGVFRVLEETVRIEEWDDKLTEVPLDFFDSLDPGRDDPGRPYHYAIDHAAADQMRMVLYPIPDAAYTIAYRAQSMVDEGGLSTIPPWMQPAIQDKATVISLTNLGLPGEERFLASYNNRLKRAKDMMLPEGPLHVQRKVTYLQPEPIESRIRT